MRRREQQVPQRRNFLSDPFCTPRDPFHTPPDHRRSPLASAPGHDFEFDDIQQFAKGIGRQPPVPIPIAHVPVTDGHAKAAFAVEPVLPPEAFTTGPTEPAVVLHDPSPTVVIGGPIRRRWMWMRRHRRDLAIILAPAALAFSIMVFWRAFRRLPSSRRMTPNAVSLTTTARPASSLVPTSNLSAMQDPTQGIVVLAAPLPSAGDDDVDSWTQEDLAPATSATRLAVASAPSHPVRPRKTSEGPLLKATDRKSTDAPRAAPAPRATATGQVPKTGPHPKSAPPSPTIDNRFDPNEI